MFGFGEKYSKEGFDATEKEVEKNKDRKIKKVTEIGRPTIKPGYDYLRDGIPMSGGFRVEYYSEYIKAQRKLESMLKKGQKEAIALNEEFNRLKADGDTSVQALHDFCVNKLGMTEEGFSAQQ